MGNDLVERLNKGCILAQDGLGGVDMNATDALCQEAAARIEALEEALKPFAEAVTKVTTDYGEGWTTGGCKAPDISDLRRASRVYANKGEPT